MTSRLLLPRYPRLSDDQPSRVSSLRRHRKWSSACGGARGKSRNRRPTLNSWNYGTFRETVKISNLLKLTRTSINITTRIRTRHDLFPRTIRITTLKVAQLLICVSKSRTPSNVGGIFFRELLRFLQRRTRTNIVH